MEKSPEYHTGLSYGGGIAMRLRDGKKAGTLLLAALLRKELEIQRDETLETLHFASLEKIFIEERICPNRTSVHCLQYPSEL